MEIPVPDILDAPDIPAHATLPLYDLPEATYSNGYSVERTSQLIRESLFGTGQLLYCKESIKKKALSSIFKGRLKI